jgi:hypothetical protein
MSETRRYIETTANGGIVSIDTERSHAATHLRQEPGLLELTKIAIRQTAIETTPDKDAAFERDMGEIIGETDLVETKPWEPRLYVRRPNREIWTPFVGRSKRPLTSFLVVILKHLDPAELDPQSLDAELRQHMQNSATANLPHHTLHSAYFGRITPWNPATEYATPESLPFWMSHALVWGPQSMDAGAEVRSDCPWLLDERQPGEA